MIRIISVILLSLCVKVAAGQSMNSSLQGNAIVYSIQSITITQNAGVVNFNTPSDYFNGVTMPDYATVRVKSNENWVISYASQSQYFSPLSKMASTNMPSTVLSLKASTAGSYVPLTTQSRTLKTGNRGGDHEFGLDVKFNPGFAYSGGLYSISIMYTLTKQ